MPGVTTASDRHGHTHRLDLADATVREWDATVVAADPEQGIVLDRSAFYPGGGGQPPDEGVLIWGGVRTRIAGTRKGDELYPLCAQMWPSAPTCCECGNRRTKFGRSLTTSIQLHISDRRAG